MFHSSLLFLTLLRHPLFVLSERKWLPCLFFLLTVSDDEIGRRMMTKDLATAIKFHIISPFYTWKAVLMRVC